MSLRLLLTMPVDVQLRVVGAMGAELRLRVRRVSVALRDLIRLWERTAPMRLCTVLRLLPKLTMLSHQPGAAATMIKGTAARVVHLRCNAYPHTARLLQMPRMGGSRLENAFFERRQDNWEASLRALVAWLTSAKVRRSVPLQHITRWRFLCVLPVYGYADSPDNFLGVGRFGARLKEALGGLTGLERVELHLCAPYKHFNVATQRVCCVRHGPGSLGYSTLLRTVLPEVLPLWTRLTHLTLSDRSFSETANDYALVELLLLALTRDAALVKLMQEAHTVEDLQLGMGARARPAALQHLRLEGVVLEGHVTVRARFWLMLGAFPPADVTLLRCSIQWPAATDVYPCTGTIFPAAFYSPSSASAAATTVAFHMPLVCPVVARRFVRGTPPVRVLVEELI